MATKVGEEEIFRSVVEVLSKVLKIKTDEVRLGSRIIDDFGTDSVEILEILTRLGDMFHIELLETDVPKIETVSDIVKYILQRLAKM